MQVTTRPRRGTFCRLAVVLMALTAPVLGREAPSNEGPAGALPEGRPLVFASDEWCPYVCFESTRAGYLVELAREVFESPARPVEVRRMSWARAIREAESGRIDGVLGAVRGESATLVYPTLAAAGDRPAFAVRAEDPWTFTGVEVLAERRIGQTCRVVLWTVDTHTLRWLVRIVGVDGGWSWSCGCVGVGGDAVGVGAGGGFVSGGGVCCGGAGGWGDH